MSVYSLIWAFSKMCVKSVVKNYLKWIDFLLIVNKNIQGHFLRLNKLNKRLI